MKEIVIENLSAAQFNRALFNSIVNEEHLLFSTFFTANTCNTYVGRVEKGGFYFYFKYSAVESSFKKMMSTWRERMLPTCLYGELVEDEHTLKVIYDIKKHMFYEKCHKFFSRPGYVFVLIGVMMGSVLFSIIILCIELYMVYQLKICLRIDEKQAYDLENKLNQVIGKAVSLSIKEKEPTKNCCL